MVSRQGWTSGSKSKLMGKSPDPLMRVGGIGSLAMSLRKIGDVELSKEMTAVSKEAAEKIVPHAKQMVPVNTGALSRSIKAGATRRYGKVIAGTASRVPYAYAVHRGRKLASGKISKATPYLSQAVKKAYPEIVKDYVKAMNKIALKFEKKHGVSRVYGRYK
jgi:hypothetical protein